MRKAEIALLLFLFPVAFCQTSNGASDGSTLKSIRYRHKVSCLCGKVEICSGDICTLRPSVYELDDDITVELRDKSGTILDTQKAAVETTEGQGTTQDGALASIKLTERRFYFEGKQDGDYLLAFILHKNGIPQPALIFPTKYSHKLNKPANAVYMLEPTWSK